MSPYELIKAHEAVPIIYSVIVFCQQLCDRNNMRCVATYGLHSPEHKDQINQRSEFIFVWLRTFWNVEGIDP